MSIKGSLVIRRINGVPTVGTRSTSTGFRAIGALSDEFWAQVEAEAKAAKNKQSGTVRRHKAAMRQIRPLVSGVSANASAGGNESRRQCRAALVAAGICR